MTGRILTPAESLAALEECLAHCKPRRTPQHPETGCPCVVCDDRDRVLEARAEEMAAERRGDYDSERDRDYMADYAADRMFGSGSDDE